MQVILSKFAKNIEVKNAFWLIGGRVIQMALSLIVGILTARYLGPSNYGLVNYGSAYVAFFTALCNLGLNSVIIKNFIDYPDEQGETIGTTLLLRTLASFFSLFMIVGISMVVDKGEITTIVVVALCSIALIFHVFETFNYWFQSQYQSKKVAIATLVAYTSVSIYKIILLILEKDIKWFAFATAFDYLVYACIIYFFYKRNSGPKLSFSMNKAKQLLSVSYHYILSGIMVAVYGYTDKIMLKQMLNETSVGYYSTATAVCAMWTFVLQAIIDSMYPSIMSLHKKGKESFEKKNRQLYATVFYVSFFVSIIITLFGKWIIIIFYGASYIPATSSLRIATWYTAFSYLGVARNAWVVCERQQMYLKYMYGIAAIMNICLNAVFIPYIGAPGAAFASLITQIFTSLILPFIFKGMRRNAVLMLQAIRFKELK